MKSESYIPVKLECIWLWCLFMVCICVCLRFVTLAMPQNIVQGEQPLNTSEVLAGAAKLPYPPSLSRFIYMENHSVGGMDDFTLPSSCPLVFTFMSLLVAVPVQSPFTGGNTCSQVCKTISMATLCYPLI